MNLNFDLPEVTDQKLEVPLDYAGGVNPEKQPRPYVQPFLKTFTGKNAAGQLESRDELWVRVTSVGGKDTLERDAKSWLEGIQAHAEAGRVPRTWPREYLAALREWQEGQELPLKGTAIKTWTALSPSQRENVLRANLRTVEDLACANDEAAGRIGMGAMALIEMAKRWVEEAAGPGQLASRNEALVAENTLLKEANARLEKRLAELEAGMPKGPSPERPTGAIVFAAES